MSLEFANIAMKQKTYIMANAIELIKDTQETIKDIEFNFNKINSEMELVKNYKKYLEYISSTVIPDINIEIEVCNERCEEPKYSSNTIEKAFFNNDVPTLYDFQRYGYMTSYKDYSNKLSTGWVSPSEDKETEKEYIDFCVKARRDLKKILTLLNKSIAYYKNYHN